VERAPLTADEYLCRAAEIEHPAGWNRRRGARLRAAVDQALANGKTPAEAHEIAMGSVGGFVLLWVGKTVVSLLIQWVIRKLMAGRAAGAIRD